ncbi:MAG: DUF2157 domain-containing protein [Burkholderiales bacterium]|nr:DUF2157 domain-containing protein [Burkholderiales bacterium]
MDRPSFDSTCRQQGLDASAVREALRRAGGLPDATAWRNFAARLLHGAGLGALGAGVLFFVAANWQDYGVFGRFVLLQAALLLSVGVALWRPPPRPVGQGALLLATLLTGGLLALFGQSYQTGADVHELFFVWALLALPFALAGGSGALWALWFGVLNVALALLCGWVGTEHVVWRALDGRAIGQPTLLMLPCLINVAAAALFAALGKARFASAAPLWLVRLLTSFGFAYGTAACIGVVVGRGLWRNQAAGASGQSVAVLLLFAALSGATAFITLRQRSDVFNMALLAASWIAISTTALGRSMRFNDLGSFFLIAFWLIATSTAAGLLLMHWVRTWPAHKSEGETA